MTKKGRRRGLLGPRSPRRFREFYGAPVAVGMNPASVLDSTEQELHPAVRPVPIDQPKKRPEFLLLKSDLIQHLNASIDAAMARSGALNSDEDHPELAMCEAAGLTRAEYEASTMRASGLKWREIGEAQGVRPATARRAAERGFRKLSAFILTG